MQNFVARVLQPLNKKPNRNLVKLGFNLDRKQAIAIAISEAREAGAKVSRKSA